MIDFFFNGEEMSRDDLVEALNRSQQYMLDAEEEIKERYGVSDDTASAIAYLRTRSRWTEEKEKELVTRDKIGFPISLGAVLSGDF
jgi:hypothetical protein